MKKLFYYSKILNAFRLCDFIRGNGTCVTKQWNLNTSNVYVTMIYRPVRQNVTEHVTRIRTKYVKYNRAYNIEVQKRYMAHDGPNTKFLQHFLDG